MDPDVLARVNRRIRWFIVGTMATAAFLVGLLTPYLPDLGTDSVSIEDVDPLTAEDELALNEKWWHTPDCLHPDEWPDGQIPASVVVRDADSRILDRITFQEAWNRAEAGLIWVILLCAELSD